VRYGLDKYGSWFLTARICFNSQVASAEVERVLRIAETDVNDWDNGTRFSRERTHERKKRQDFEGDSATVFIAFRWVILDSRMVASPKRKEGESGMGCPHSTTSRKEWSGFTTHVVFSPSRARHPGSVRLGRFSGIVPIGYGALAKSLRSEPLCEWRCGRLKTQPQAAAVKISGNSRFARRRVSAPVQALASRGR